MKLVKTFTALALSLAVLICSAFGAGAAGSYFLSEGFYYGVNNGEAYVHGYEGDSWSVIIREKFLSYYVTEVEDYAFFENETVRSLSFIDASRLSKIGKFAFNGCVNLRSVDVTSTIQEMGECAFDGCTSLTSVRFRSNSVTAIPKQAFYNCSSLKSVTFENAPESIGDFAFANCTSLEKIEIPNSVTSISPTAFSGCDGLVIRCSSGSYAMSYAIENNIDYELTDVLLGDADKNGVVNVIDVTVIQKVLAGIRQDADGAIALRGDVNGDNSLTIRDATLIQMYLAGYTTPFDIGKAMQK